MKDIAREVGLVMVKSKKNENLNPNVAGCRGRFLCLIFNHKVPMQKCVPLRGGLEEASLSLCRAWQNYDLPRVSDSDHDKSANPKHTPSNQLEEVPAGLGRRRFLRCFPVHLSERQRGQAA